jgi:hypothetical protein
MDPVLAFFSRNEKRVAVPEATCSNQERAWRHRNSVWAVSENCDRRGIGPLAQLGDSKRLSSGLSR